ncbi:hypothetical protein Bca101_067155 [Brassica carinata]
MELTGVKNSALFLYSDGEMNKLTKVPAEAVSQGMLRWFTTYMLTRKVQAQGNVLASYICVQDHWRNNKECVLVSWRQGYTSSWRQEKKEKKKKLQTALEDSKKRVHVK